MSTFLTEFRAVHARSLAFCRAALPLVAAVPLVAEFVQHVVEMRIGMYASPDAAEATADNAQRLNFGFAKVIALSLPAYFFFRWLHSGGASDFATRYRRSSCRRPFALVLSLQALLAMAEPVRLDRWPDGHRFLRLRPDFHAAGGAFRRPRLRRSAHSSALSSRSARWPRTRCSPSSSRLPPCCRSAIVHYALGIGAIFVASDALKWAMLGLDSFVTAWLALVMIAAQYVDCPYAASEDMPIAIAAPWPTAPDADRLTGSPQIP